MRCAVPITYDERIWRLIRDFDVIMGHEQARTFTTESDTLDITNLSNTLRAVVSCWPVSSRYHRFETNVCKFCTLVTGNAGVSFQDVFKALRDYVTWQKQQWTPIYKQIREQGTELAKKQRVITSLGFRHVLENLPDQSKILAEFGLTKAPSATGTWQLTWQLAVEQKLIMMLQEHVSKLALNTPQPSTAPTAASNPSPTPGLPSTPASTPAPSGPSSKSAVGPGMATTKPPSDPLREILQHDLEYWISKLKRDKAGNTKLTTHASQITAEYQRMTSTATGAGPPPAPPTGAKKSTYTQLFIDLGLDYASWNGYQRGFGLYGELSGSIHKYSQTFEVHETGWARNDWLVLQWLKPAQDANGEVLWDGTRKRLGPPFTP